MRHFIYTVYFLSVKEQIGIKPNQTRYFYFALVLTKSFYNHITINYHEKKIPIHIYIFIIWGMHLTHIKKHSTFGGYENSRKSN